MIRPLIKSNLAEHPLKPNKGKNGCTRGVMVIVAGIEHGDTSSNPGLNAFHIALIPLGKV